MPSAMPLVHVRFESRHREKLERIRADLGFPSEASVLRWLVERADDPAARSKVGRKKNSGQGVD